MYWKKQKLDYKILEYPVEKTFEKFSNQEAKDYFEWYLNNKNERINYLSTYSSVDLDYSEKSLVDVWDWFLHTATIEKTSRHSLTELKKKLEKQPRNIVDIVLNEHKKQFSLQTEYIIMDIAIYFGEVLIHNNNVLFWGYHTDIKKDSFANMPLIMGFEDRDFNPPFHSGIDPLFSVRCSAWSILECKTSKNELLHYYNKLKRMIFNNQ